MALRLGYSSTSASSTDVNRLAGDVSLSQLQIVDCLKTLKVILTNLVDPSKSGDIKYRTLKLENPKLQQKLFAIPYVKQELLQDVLGFEISSTTDTNEACLVMKTLPSDTAPLRRCLDEITSSLAALSASVGVGSGNANVDGTDHTKMVEPLQPSNKKPKLPPTEQLSEKQRARRLMEQKEQQEREKAKEERKRQVELLKQDKLVRQTDPNWKPGVSAACAKSGTGISTFRDKYGEN